VACGSLLFSQAEGSLPVCFRSPPFVQSGSCCDWINCSYRFGNLGFERNEKELCDSGTAHLSVNYVIWRKRELGFMNNVKPQTRQLRIVRRLLLRNFLGAGSVFLFLVCRVGLCLFLRRLLARGFRRFVAHKHNAKVHGNRRQLRGQRRSRWAPAPISGAVGKGSRDTGAVTPCCMYNAYHGCPIVVRYSLELAKERRKGRCASRTAVKGRSRIDSERV
jgi:hypothetical protein